MSSFGGKLREYSAISIDKFDDKNLLSTAYFLSHCHADHMVGLGSPQFHQRLKASRLKLYTSAISRAFLLADEAYAHLDPHIDALPTDEPVTLQIPDKLSTCKAEDLVVTLIPAGHCPGSVMFLFEGKEGSVLYTGDFRIAAGDASKLKSLHSAGRIKDICSMYVDTTFGCPKSMHFPTREQSRDALVEIVSSWISRSPHHVVYLNCPAQFGYEYLFVELYKHFNMKVHISDQKIKKYAGVQEIMEAVTSDKQATRIHACFYKKHTACKNLSRLPCGYCVAIPNKPITKTIKISIMWYAISVTAKDIVVGKPHSLYARVCFSTHSSYTEIMELVRYINPKKVFPNVVPVGVSYTEVANRLASILPKEQTASNNNAQLLGSLKRPRSQNESSSIESNLLFDSDSCSPKFKRNCPGQYHQSVDQVSSQETNDSSYIESPIHTNAGLLSHSRNNSESSVDASPVKSSQCSANPHSEDLFTEHSDKVDGITRYPSTLKKSTLNNTKCVEVVDLTGEETEESGVLDTVCRESSPEILILHTVKKCHSEYDSDETTDCLSGTPRSQQLLTQDSDITDVDITPDKVQSCYTAQVETVVRKISF